VPQHSNRLLNPEDQSLGVVVEIWVGAHRGCVSIGQLPQALRQFLRGWHRAIPHQHGDDRNLATKSSLDLDPNKGARIVESASSTLVGDRKPRVPDQSKENVTASDPLGKELAKIQAWRNRIDVLEDLSRTEVRRKAIVQPARLMLAILAPIRD